MAYLNTKTGDYPLSAADVRAACPNTSFPSSAVDFEASLPGLGYAVVQPTVQPAVDYTKNLAEADPEKAGNVYKQTWEVSDATAAEIFQRIRGNANYRVFWDALLTSTVYSAIRTQSMASLPMNTLATEFIALLGDAKAGRPNEAAIQASMEALLTTGTFTQDHLAELGEALEAGKLDGIYDI